MRRRLPAAGRPGGWHRRGVRQKPPAPQRRRHRAYGGRGAGRGRCRRRRRHRARRWRPWRRPTDCRGRCRQRAGAPLPARCATPSPGRAACGRNARWWTRDWMASQLQDNRGAIHSRRRGPCRAPTRVLDRFGESWPEMLRKPGTDTNFRRSLPEFGCLFECISMVLQSGSPEGYNAETGFCEPAQKPQSGEPYEHHTLYRIRRSQEKHQLLRQDCRRQDHRRGQTAGHAPSAAGVGTEAHGTLARGDGSDTVQQLDLRRTETLCRRTADGEPLDDESHRRGQEEERPTGCPQDRRPGALQSAAGLLCGSAGDARSETVAALPEPGGGAGGADEEPNERSVDGSGSGIQQTTTARGQVFQRAAGPVGRSAGIGEGSVAAEPWGAGDVRLDAAPAARPITERSSAGEAGEPAEEHPRRGRGDGADIGTGDLRPAAVPLHRGRGELLRIDLGAEVVGRQTAAGADQQATQRAFADGADRGGETGAAVEQTVGRTARAGTEARRSQPGDLGGGAEAGSVFVGGGQIGQAVRGAQPAGKGDAGGGQASGLKTRSELTSGKGDFLTKAARRDGSDARTVLAVKGSLRRAKTGRALDGSGPFRRKYRCDGRLRRENHPDPAVCSDATIDQRSTGRSSLPWDCTTEARLPMCQLVCFEAGRFPQIQSSWTALCCSRKWMSGPADALAPFQRDRKRSIVALTVGFIIQALQNLPGSAGRSVFSLDKYLSWMSQGLPAGYAIAFGVPPKRLGTLRAGSVES